jgi:hypothetical protein
VFSSPDSSSRTPKAVSILQVLACGATIDIVMGVVVVSACMVATDHTEAQRLDPGDIFLCAGGAKPVLGIVFGVCLLAWQQWTVLGPSECGGRRFAGAAAGLVGI